MNIEEILQKLPGVATPIKRLTFRDKLTWTGIILILYFILSDIPVYGISSHTLVRFEELATLMGASFGSLITLGIGPIVMASIILQLLVGSKVINWDLTTHHGKVMFQGTQKILAIAFAVGEATAYTVFGAVQPASFASSVIIAVIFQIALGGVLIIFMDEVVSKWGFGSGVGLFIAAGVSKELVIAAFNFKMTAALIPAGRVTGLIYSIIQGAPQWIYLLPIISTIIVFAIVVYAQSMRVEIPLAFGSFRGFGRKWPLKFIYTNVMPVILISAVLINLQVWASLLAAKGLPILGTFSADGVPISGLVHYLNPPRQFIWNLIHLNIISDEVIRVLAYSVFMIVGAAVFSMFWVNTSGMDARSIANQIQSSGLQIPGFRRDPRVIERVLSRYITPLAILGGAFVGFLAAFADFTGALARGTAILLAVMIIYQLYEQLVTQHFDDMHPMLRKFIERI